MIRNYLSDHCIYALRMIEVQPRWIRSTWIALGLSIPLSIRIYFPFIGTEVIFPAEPLLAFLFLLFCWQLAFQRPMISSLMDSWKEPVIFLSICWILVHIVSAAFSSLKMVSLKSTLVQIIYIGVLVLLPVTAGVTGRENTRLAMRWHDRVFLLVVVFSLTTQSVVGFDRMGANFSSFPFYMDHTIFGAALTFVLFRYLTKTWGEFHSGSSASRKWVLLTISILLLITLVVNHGRAAWLAVLVALGIAAAFRSGATFRGVLMSAAIVIPVLIAFHAPMLALLRSNQVASQAHGTGLRGTAMSIWNVTTDTSNRERITRWTSAWLMFRDHPITGTGPGTYQYFHHSMLTPAELERSSSDRLIPDEEIIPAWKAGDVLLVRNNAESSPSNGGTAHSEYLLALSERGILGALWWLVAGVVILKFTNRVFARDQKRSRSKEVYFAAFALIAYLVHAGVNNFLDDVKVALPFWIALGWLWSDPRNAEISHTIKTHSRPPLQ